MKKVMQAAGVVSLALTLGAWAPAVRAQEEPPPAVEPQEVEQDPVPAPAEPLPPPGPRHFGLYAAVGYGGGSSDPINLNLQTFTTDLSEGSLELDDMQRAHAALGWQFANDQGDLRLVFNGHKEEGYRFDAVGKQRALAGVTSMPPILLDWWEVTIDDGQLVSRRTPHVWQQGEFILVDHDMDPSTPDQCTVLSGDDLNCNNVPDPSEIRELPPDALVVRDVTDTLQNQIQTVDLIYGRDFGGRRFSSHWWGGVRYFDYKGNAPTLAWLNVDFAGQGFTSGAFFRPITLYQETNGFGPTGSWEVDVNFFDGMVAVFGRAQAALTFNSYQTDSGPFFTLLRTTTGVQITSPARLQESRDKTTWQTLAELGVRLGLRNGLQFELAYTRSGFLDLILAPSDIAIPENEVQTGVSAVYNTQDVVIDSWHAGVALQF